MSKIFWRGGAIALTAFVIGAVAYMAGVNSVTGQFIEAKALAASTLDYDPGPPLSLVSARFVAVAVGVIALLAAASWGIGRAFIVGFASVAAIAMSQLLKFSVLERPALWEFNAHNTFPSGHMTVFAALALGIIAASPKALRVIMSAIMSVTLAVVAVQLLYAGWHRPSDIVGGLMLALAFYALMFFVTPHKRSVKSTGEKTLQKILGFAIMILLVLSLFVSVWALAKSDTRALLYVASFVCAAAAVYTCRAGNILARA